MAATSPLTGDVKSTRSSFLLKNNGVPAFTLSPAFTSNLGVTPSKSSGETAYSAACGAAAASAQGLPWRLMSRPLRNVMTFDMVEMIRLNMFFRRLSLRRSGGPCLLRPFPAAARRSDPVPAVALSFPAIFPRTSFFGSAASLFGRRRFRSAARKTAHSARIGTLPARC